MRLCTSAASGVAFTLTLPSRSGSLEARTSQPYVTARTCMHIHSSRNQRDVPVWWLPSVDTQHDYDSTLSPTTVITNHWSKISEQCNDCRFNKCLYSSSSTLFARYIMYRYRYRDFVAYGECKWRFEVTDNLNINKLITLFRCNLWLAIIS